MFLLHSLKVWFKMKFVLPLDVFSNVSLRDRLIINRFFLCQNSDYVAMLARSNCDWQLVCMEDSRGVSSQKQSRFEQATWSLATFVRLHRSLRSLALQRSVHFAHSLVGQLKFLNMCSHCVHISWEETRFWRSLETRPMLDLWSFRVRTTRMTKDMTWN